MEFFVLFLTFCNWSVLDDDGLWIIHPLWGCAPGLSDKLLMFTEARKGLPVRVDRWISGGRADSLKEVIIYEVEL